MKVFSFINRQDENSADYSEAFFPYLDRSARIPAQRVRDVIELWFANYPVDEQKEMLYRLRSKDDRDFCPAFFELYIHEILHRLGYKVAIHPKVESGSKTPDFLVTSDEEEFYIEVVTPSERGPKDIVGETLLNMALDKINEIESTDFLIELRIRGLPKKPLPGKSYQSELRSWIGDMNYDIIRMIYDEKGLEGMPEKNFSYPGGQITVRPIPKYENRGQNCTLIGEHSMGIRKLNTSGAIRKAIDDKKSRYGDLGKPYILAINVITMSLDEVNIMDALFGSEQYIFNMDNSSNNPPLMSRANDGSWSTTKGTKVSGILVTRSLSPWTVSACNLTLYQNPWAKYPYHGNLNRLPVAEPRSDGHVYWIDGIHSREILGLPERWPENEVVET